MARSSSLLWRRSAGEDAGWGKLVLEASAPWCRQGLALQGIVLFFAQLVRAPLVPFHLVTLVTVCLSRPYLHTGKWAWAKACPSPLGGLR